jgi:hypothetical protein
MILNIISSLEAVRGGMGELFWSAVGTLEFLRVSVYHSLSNFYNSMN